MRQKQLGRSGLFVSELALGAMTFGATGWGCDEETAIGLVHRYLEAGGNFIDTADIYGPSEDIVGRALQGRRPEVVLSTKVGLPGGSSQNDRGAGRAHIVKACESSLRRLGTDYLDLYWVHLDDDAIPLEETVAALDHLVRAGKVLYTGASNFHAFRLMKALAVSDRLMATRFVAFQGQYSLIARGLEREHFRLFDEEGLGFVSWSPLGAGMLTGKVRPDGAGENTRLAQRNSRADQLIKNERGFAIAAEVQKAAAELGCTPAQLALAWQRGRPVTSVIIGVRTEGQLDDNLSSLNVSVTPDVLARLEAITRPPDEYPGSFIDIFQGWIRRGDNLY